MRRHRTGSATAIAIVLIGVAIAGAWLLVAPSILTSAPILEGPLAHAGPAAPAPAGLRQDAPAMGAFQVAQPRDPFRPLITESSQTGTGGGGGGTYEPSGTRITLVEITEVGGVRRATVTVDSTTYDVGVGDTFADRYMVVSLDADGGVFLYGDNAFTLKVGQEILK